MTSAANKYIEPPALPDRSQTDIDSIPDLVDELIKTVTSTSLYGLRARNRTDRLCARARIGFLAARAAELEANDMRREYWERAREEGSLAAVVGGEE